MLSRLVAAVWATSFALATPAWAAPKRDKGLSAPEAEVERLEIAREHFLKGEQLANTGSLEAALVELELAEVAHPSAMVADAKRRVRASIEARHVVAPIAAAPPTMATPRHRSLRPFAAPIVLAPLALGGLVAGGALLGTVRSDVARLQRTCSPGCAPGEVDPLRTRQSAAEGLLAVGAILAAGDAVLWGLLAARRAHEPAVHASAVADPSGGGLIVAGRF